jgi:HlyD family secretion protein
MARKKKSLIFLVVIGVMAILFGLKGFIPVKVKTVKPEKRDLVSEVYGNGTVEAKVVVGISSKITGRIVELYADQGDQVRQGQLLAKLENTDFIEQHKKTEAELKHMTANISIEEANLEKARSNLSLAEKNRERFRNLAQKNLRSEERRVGKECRRLCRSRWSPYH